MKGSRFLEFYVVAVRESLARWGGNGAVKDDDVVLMAERRHFIQSVLKKIDDPAARKLMIQRQAGCTHLPSWFGNALELTLYQVGDLVK